MWEINCDITKFFFFFLVKIYRIFNSATLTSRNCIFIPVCVFTEWVYYSVWFTEHVPKGMTCWQYLSFLWF